MNYAVVGLLIKIIGYLKTPTPFKIPMTPGPSSSSGVFFKIVRYIFFGKIVEPDNMNDVLDITFT